MSARRHKLPPLVRGYQVDDLAIPIYGPEIFCTLKEARSRMSSYSNFDSPAIIRRLGDGKVMARNAAARRAGY